MCQFVWAKILKWQGVFQHADAKMIKVGGYFANVSWIDDLENFGDFAPHELQTTLILRVVWFEGLSCLNRLVGLLVVLGLTALWDNISVYIGPSPKEREKEEKG